jgi:hypothetical protein
MPRWRMMGFLPAGKGFLQDRAAGTILLTSAIWFAHIALPLATARIAVNHAPRLGK